MLVNEKEFHEFLTSCFPSEIQDLLDYSSNFNLLQKQIGKIDLRSSMLLLSFHQWLSYQYLKGNNPMTIDNRGVRDPIRFALAWIFSIHYSKGKNQYNKKAAAKKLGILDADNGISTISGRIKKAEQAIEASKSNFEGISKGYNLMVINDYVGQAASIYMSLKKANKGKEFELEVEDFSFDLKRQKRFSDTFLYSISNFTVYNPIEVTNYKFIDE